MGIIQQKPRYERAPQFDKRFMWGDDFAGDAWRDRETGQIFWCVVGRDPNESEVADA